MLVLLAWAVTAAYDSGFTENSLIRPTKRYSSYEFLDPSIHAVFVRSYTLIGPAL